MNTQVVDHGPGSGLLAVVRPRTRQKYAPLGRVMLGAKLVARTTCVPPMGALNSLSGLICSSYALAPVNGCQSSTISSIVGEFVFAGAVWTGARGPGHPVGTRRPSTATARPRTTCRGRASRTVVFSGGLTGV